MRVFKTGLIHLQSTTEEPEALTMDFILYKRDGVLPDIFGHDALYDDSFTWPLTKFERVAHTHLVNMNSPFPPQLRQFGRMDDAAHLVYCRGTFDEQAWLLIAVLKPEPHKLARDNSQMRKIGKMVEAFHTRFWIYIMSNMQIRDYQPGDFQQLCIILLRAVTMMASQHYSPQQIATWAQIDESR